MPDGPATITDPTVSENTGIAGHNISRITMQRTTIRSTAAGLLTVALIGGVAGAAQAKSGNDPEVRKSGHCSASTVWKLKAKSDDGRLEVEFEVDSNRNGQRWSVAINDNDVRVFTGARTTVAPSGSFEVERHIANRAGTDRTTASATNANTGERCDGVLAY